MYAKHDHVLFGEAGGVVSVPESHSRSVAAARASEEVQQHFVPPEVTQRYRLSVGGFKHEIIDSRSEVIFNHNRP